MPTLTWEKIKLLNAVILKEEDSARSAKERAFGAKKENIEMNQSRNRLPHLLVHRLWDGDRQLTILVDLIPANQNWIDLEFAGELSMMMAIYEHDPIIHKADKLWKKYLDINCDEIITVLFIQIRHLPFDT